MSYASSYGDPNPPTPAFSDTRDWIHYYLAIHVLSPASYRYAYMLWFEILFIVIVFGLLGRIPGGNVKHSALRARWHKWSIQRPSFWRFWKRKRATLQAADPSTPPPPRKVRQPAWWKIKFSELPVKGDLLSLFFLIVSIVLASVLGPDYLKPSIRALDLSKFSRRSETIGLASRDYTIVPVSIPGYTIWKAWWTAGNRTGLIAFTLFPLCVVAVLKAPPFAVFALRFPAHVYSDRLAWLHRWTGRIIYTLTVAHVSLWSVQLTKDKRVGVNGGGIAWLYVFDYPKFIFGIVAFVCMTLLFALSFPSFRSSDFELFYLLHVTLVPLTLVFSALHHPPVAPWCWATLGLWAAERFYRLMKNVWVNGSFFSEKVPALPPSLFGGDSAPVTRRSSFASTLLSPLSAKDHMHAPFNSPSSRPTFPPKPTLSMSSDLDLIPPGCGRAELLPGRTIRLTVRPVRSLSPAAGQYAFLAIPTLSRFTSHPFTIVSARDLSLIPSSQRPTTSNQILEFIVRARQGLTLDLWNHLNAIRTHDPRTGRYIPPLLRVRVDGSYGSSVRVNWQSYGSVLVVVGGSGVAFGLSILGTLCHAIAEAHEKLHSENLSGAETKQRSKWFSSGRTLEQKRLESLKTNRIRFVWLVREYSHLMWCASSLRQFVQMVPPDVLHIDIFVTNFAPSISRAPTSRVGHDLSRIKTGDTLVPPTPMFASSKPRHHRPQSPDGAASDSEDGWDSDDSLADVSYAVGARHRSSGGEEMDVADGNNLFMALTNFDGEEDEQTSKAVKFSEKVKKQGLLVRKKTAVNIESRRSLEQSLHTTHISAHSPLSPQYTAPNSSHFNEIHTSPQRLSFNGPASPISPSRTQGNNHFHHARRLSTRKSVAESLYSQFSAAPSSHLDADSQSLRNLLTASEAHLPQNRSREGGALDYLFQLSRHEQDDMGYIAALARPGRPRLDKILSSEVERSTGALAVACCGPTSLDKVVRNLVSNQIDPVRVKKGDQRGFVTFYNEEFSF
ncbi:hypothetical protein DL93DRAFT_2053769 [Clavulina sp. PMI_390]|nr:hypothetical protein DL93DRAFT_2053769 [Clavulina sp. PMI_390]